MPNFFQNNQKIWMVLFVFTTLFFIAPIANAQFGLTGTQQTGSIQISVSPQNPRPGQTVSLSVTSSTIDINRATISWYNNNKLISTTLGSNNISIAMGDIGTTDTVRVVVNSVTGSVTEKTIQIRPADILLVWQADSYTPAFYRGKSLRPAEGDALVTAIPDIVVNGARVPSSSVVYTWEQDDVVMGDRSGLGRDTFIAEGSVLSRPLKITVTAETFDGSTKAKRTIEIPVASPEIYIYERDPLLGILFNTAIKSSFSVLKEETTLELFPYFFSTNNRESGLLYDWRVDGKKLSNERTPSITLRHVGATGQISLSSTIKNPTRILEFGSGAIKVDFGI